MKISAPNVQKKGGVVYFFHGTLMFSIIPISAEKQNCEKNQSDLGINQLNQDV